LKYYVSNTIRGILMFWGWSSLISGPAPKRSALEPGMLRAEEKSPGRWRIIAKSVKEELLRAAN
jgi:hypothetical protein